LAPSPSHCFAMGPSLSHFVGEGLSSYASALVRSISSL